MTVKRALMATLIAASTAATVHANPLCWSEPRVYAAGEDDAPEILAAFDASLAIDQVPMPLPPPFVLNTTRAYAYSLRETAITNSWSGATHYELLVFNEQPTLLRLAIRPVWSIENVTWVSQRLLYLRVWVGRSTAVDTLLDVESGRLVYREALLDGSALYQQAHDSCRSLPNHPDCNPTCRSVDGR